MKPNALAGLLMFLATIIGASATVHAGAPDELIARVVRAYGLNAGGDPQPDNVMRLQGTIRSFRRSETGTIVRESAWPDFLRVDIRYGSGAGETRLLYKDKGWRDGKPAPAPLVDAMRLQLARMSLPMLLHWERESITELGPAVREDGRAVRRLRVGLSDHLALYVEIETATGHILRSAGVMTAGGAEMSFGAAYSDFRSFGDVTWPAREDQSAMGQAIGWTVIESIEYGRPFDPTRVEP